MQSRMAVGKRDFSDLRSSWTMPPVVIDEAVYRSMVLQLSDTETEEQIDERILYEAQTLGLMSTPTIPESDNMSTSVSVNTLASDHNPNSSILSQSTAPTSCASSEHRPVTQSSMLSEQSHPPSVLSEEDKRRSSGFRKSFRKMTGFKKRRSIVTSPTLTSITSDSADTNQSDHTSIKSGMKSPGSIKSSKSSWSSPMSGAKSSYEPSLPVDQDALRRSRECKEMLGLRTTQLDEKSRFLRFQQSLIGQIRETRDAMKREKVESHHGIIDEQQEKNYKAIEDLESRQLEEEMRLQGEHDQEKRTVMIRLKHMEAYCQNPTPPSTPVDGGSIRSSGDSHLPERRVTDKDYHNLAQQYRERDAMDNLHASKINVLRGKQKKAVENLMRKKDREIELLETQQQREIDFIDQQFSTQEAQLRLAFGSKRNRLEMRWRTMALIERTKVERATGLKYAPLPDVIAAEEVNSIA